MIEKTFFVSFLPHPLYLNLKFFLQTSTGHLLFYGLSVSSDYKGLYEQQDSPSPNLRRESAELFVKEVIPALVLTPVSALLEP